MIGYLCKYTPVEILEACGAETALLTPHVNEFPLAGSLLHNNVCSYTKAVLEEFDRGMYEGLVLTSCCDSVRRLYDALKARFPDRFIHILDLPRKVNDFTISLYKQEVQKLIDAYTAWSGSDFDPQLLYDLCRRKREAARIDGLAQKQAAASPKEGTLHIALAGARPGATLRQLILDHGAVIDWDLTCTAVTRSYRLGRSALLTSYCHELLNQLPCMRMAKGTNRERMLDLICEKADGLIYHTVQFCDIYSYEYAGLKARGSIPILKLETDTTEASAGQILTRIEAFLESLTAKKKGTPTVPAKQPQAVLPRKTKGKTMYVMGIDSGSTSTNAVILNSDRQILAFHILRTGAKSADSAAAAMHDVLKKAGLTRGDLSQIVSTGYGRVSIPFADRNLTEISCHARGAHFLNPGVRTILDIGGQDSKAIRITDHGEVADFVMNDKCAAGTGRFLEMMARTLELPIDALGPVSLNWKESIQISSMCSVFAESEVISLIAQNKETADIAHGIHEAIVSRAISLIRRVGMTPGYMMTGGVAKNPGVAAELKRQLHAPVFLPDEPEIVGALGAALHALEII